jgi:hypothetical protein
MIHPVTKANRTRIPVAIALITLVGTTGLSQQRRPNFSGRWELDRGDNRLSSSIAEKNEILSQTIEHSEPNIKIVRTVKSREGQKDLRILLVTNGEPKTNQVEGHALVFRARWKGNRLFIEVHSYLENNPTGMMEIWSLSKDGKTLSVELNQIGTKVDSGEKLVYLKSP